MTPFEANFARNPKELPPLREQPPKVMDRIEAELRTPLMTFLLLCMLSLLLGFFATLAFYWGTGL